MAEKDPDLGKEGWLFRVHSHYDVVNDAEMVRVSVSAPRPKHDLSVILRHPLNGTQIVEALRALADAVERGQPIRVPDEPFARHG